MISGICSLCKNVSAVVYNCNFCGRLICPRCYDFSRGICKGCLSKWKKSSL